MVTAQSLIRDTEGMLLVCHGPKKTNSKCHIYVSFSCILVFLVIYSECISSPACRS